MLTVSTMVYRLVCRFVPGDHTGPPPRFHIENYDVSCRRMLTAPYNGLSYGMRTRTGRPHGVAPTELSFTMLFRGGRMSSGPTMVYRLVCGLVPGDHTGSPLRNYRLLCCFARADANRPLQRFIVWYADSYRATTRGRPYSIISNIMVFRGGRMSSAHPTTVYRLVCGFVQGDHAGSLLRYHIENYDVSCRWMLTVYTTVYRLVCGLYRATTRGRPTVSRGDNIRLTLTE